MADAFDVTLDRDRGTLRGQPGDWLVQYAPSDFSVVSARVFAQTYEVARLTTPGAAVSARPKLALILSGGGARAAYQAGVARAISEMLPDGTTSPFRMSANPRQGRSTPPRSRQARAISALRRRCRANRGRRSVSRMSIVRTAGTLRKQDGGSCARFFPVPTVSGRLRCSTMRRWSRFWREPFTFRRSTTASTPAHLDA